jgi:hypothetical protein
MKSLYYRARRRPPAGFLPETDDFSRRVRASGGAISNASAFAIDDFARGLMEADLWGKIIDMGPFVGSWPGCMVKLKYPVGVASSLTNVNFVAGDYVETGASAGLLGNGATKALRTGVAQSVLGPAAHACFYLREAMANTATHAMIGAGTTGEDFVLMQSTTEMRGLHGKAIYANIADLGAGFWGVNRTGGTDLRLYKNGASVAVNSTATTPGTTGNDFALFAENIDGTNSSYLNRRGCFYSLGQSLTGAEMAAFYQLVQSLQIAMNRSV